ncbi:MAG: signal peptidase I [Clostridia bacterium]|nr:signal peptidase I [Clostridia bacterium]
MKKAEFRAAVSSAMRMISVIAILAVLFAVFFGFRIVRGNGMYPALSDGDLVLTYFNPSFIKGEIVFFEIDGEERFGRIVAKEGDVIDFSDDGKFYVNGTAQTSEVVFPTYPPEGWGGGVTVPEGKVFILGDYRTQSEDSRVFGFVSKDQIKFKVVAVLRHKSI